MKNVICIDDKNLPQGAYVSCEEKYIVEEEYINALDQRVYIIKGAVNQGTTKLGMVWKGYRADRFSTLVEGKIEKKETAFAFN